MYLNVVCTCYYFTSVKSPMAKGDLLYRDLLYEGISSKDCNIVAERERQKQEEIDSALELNFLYRKICHK